MNLNWQLIDDYCVLDLETTGFSPRFHEIIEVGILRIRDNNIVQRYSHLVAPQHSYINAKIQSLTGISPEMVADQPSIDELRYEILDFIGQDPIVGHNLSFDMNFLTAALCRDIDNICIDTLPIARQLFPELGRHRLSDLTEYLCLSCNEHRALADCVATKELFDVEKNRIL